MKSLASLFARSPFGPLVEHARKVRECVQVIQPMVDAFLEGEYEKVEKFQRKLSKTEHEADLIKNSIRERLPKQFFLAVSQADFLNFLHQQDEIADVAEDMAVILTYRRKRMHPDLIEPFQEFLHKVLEACDLTISMAEELNLLMEASFGGPEADKVLKLVEEVARKEWEADCLERALVRKMYSIEEELSPVDIHVFSQLFKALDDMADHSENTANSLRLMILKG